MAINTVEAAQRHLKIAPFNPYRLAIEQGVSQFISGCCQHPVKGRA